MVKPSIRSLEFLATYIIYYILLRFKYYNNSSCQSSPNFIEHWPHAKNQHCLPVSLQLFSCTFFYVFSKVQLFFNCFLIAVLIQAKLFKEINGSVMKFYVFLLGIILVASFSVNDVQGSHGADGKSKSNVLSITSKSFFKSSRRPALI